ncbi:MAG: hypothetical protein CFE21_07940 [Bacteroidetes bacterium B1(2017)]|nr:MAG: hypothetical protein CFE21_07940 [Bacteroidetes bacterium B1(2017)]
MRKKLLNLFALVALGIGANAQISETLVKTEFTNALLKENFLNANEVNFSVSSQYTSAHNGVTHVYGNQTLNGVEVFNANVDIHFSKDGKVIGYHHNFIPNIAQKVNATKPKVGAIQAMQTALATEGMSATTLANKAPLAENSVLTWFEPTVSTEKIRVKAGYFAIADEVKLVWQLEFLNDETNDFWNKKVDAQTGLVIAQNNYTTFCNFEPKAETKSSSSFLFEDETAPLSLGKKATTGTYNVFPLPLESPNHGPRSLMTDIASANASPFGWHDTNGVVGPEFLITRGNNVWAKEDTLNNNGSTGGYSPNGGDSLIFDYPYSISAKPRANLNAAIVNLFYWNNILHDIFFNYGFDEKSGNYQQKNLSANGLGRDAVMADAQDGSGTSNANFSAPVDGISGRMQMYVWPTSGASTSNNTLGVSYPNSIKGVFYGPQSTSGPRLTPEGLKGKIVLLMDSVVGVTGTTTSNGCGLIANSSELAGNIVLIDRGGTCGTSSTANRNKIKAAQAAGAIAVIIAHNTNGLTPTAVTGTDAAITIPSIIIGYGTGVMIKTALQSDSVMAILFDSSAFNTAKVYDSDLDNGVMTHEYGHGISIRLTGGPANSSCLNNREQGGEGWSDFFALALTTRVWENPATVKKGIGTFVYDQDTTGLGIRQYRYSRSMTVNPLTYNSVKLNTEVHATGTVWCTVLYDLYLDMIDKYGFNPDWYAGNGGNNKMMQLVMDGLKLQPCSPGFLDARNAIILADSINNGGANKDLLWKGFARRGMGFYANQGSSASATDQVENFSLPPATGLNQIEESDNFRLYPNPALTEITVDVFGGAKITGIEIYDIEGKLVQQKLVQGNLPSTTLKLSEHPTGYYLVKITSNEGVAYKKLLIN